MVEPLSEASERHRHESRALPTVRGAALGHDEGRKTLAIAASLIADWPKQTCPRIISWQMSGDYSRIAQAIDTRESPRQRFSTWVKNP